MGPGTWTSTEMNTKHWLKFENFWCLGRLPPLELWLGLIDWNLQQRFTHPLFIYKALLLGLGIQAVCLFMTFCEYHLFSQLQSVDTYIFGKWV